MKANSGRGVSYLCLGWRGKDASISATGSAACVDNRCVVAVRVQTGIGSGVYQQQASRVDTSSEVSATGAGRGGFGEAADSNIGGYRLVDVQD